MSVPVLAPNNQLNIRGVISSNISSTPTLTSYPTSTTGTSLGHYSFTDISSNSTTQLNVSGSSSGGHIFTHASATQTPIEVMAVNRNGLFINTNLNVSDLSGNSSILQSNNLNISDISNNSLVLQSNNLNILDISGNSSVLEKNKLKILDSNGDSSVLQTNNLTLSNSSTSNSMILNNLSNPDLTLTNTNLQQCVLLANKLSYIRPDNNSLGTFEAFQSTFSQNTTTSIHQSDSIRFQDNASTKAIYLNNTIPSPFIRTNDTNNNESILTANNLTFNGFPYSITQVVPQSFVSSPAFYADSSIAIQPSPFLTTYGFGGWAYKKASPQASNAKINWYFPFPINNGIVGDLKGLYYQIFNNCSSSDALPFFTVYTRPTGVNDYASWYHSSMTYVCTTNSSANQTVQAYANIKSLPFIPNSIAIQNQLPMIQSTVNNPRGTYLDTDVVLFIAFGTNSASPLNAVDFSCSKIGMITNTYSAEYNLI
jgi:hypothetical protein